MRIPWLPSAGCWDLASTASKPRKTTVQTLEIEVKTIKQTLETEEKE